MSETSHIFIQDECFSPDKLKTIAHQKRTAALTNWENEFYQFIIEWFNPNNYIEVKTSGSTGQPKNIRLDKQAMQKSAERTILHFKLKPNDHLLLSLSCNYIAGKMMVVRALYGHMNLTVVDPSTDFSFLNQTTYDMGAVVPLQLNKLLDREDGQNCVENIRHWLVGGSSVPTSLEQKISPLKSNIVSTYGMTETASHIAVRTLSGASVSDSYYCLPGISIRKNTNECLEIHAEGQNEWLSTTDLVEIISPKEFKILGRADHAIISGGLKFHPEQLEKKLQRFIPQPFIISSEPDDKLGQKLILVVEGKLSPTEKEAMHQIIKQCFNRYERPKNIRCVAQLPRNANGKIVRK